MYSSNINRQASAYQAQANGSIDAIIKEGISVQRNRNTVCAIEFLKNRGIDSSTIQRVLAGFYLHQEYPRDPAGLS